jgi:hypothetical protein
MILVLTRKVLHNSLYGGRREHKVQNNLLLLQSPGSFQNSSEARRCSTTLLLAPNIPSHFQFVLSCQQRQIVVELETVIKAVG